MPFACAKEEMTWYQRCQLSVSSGLLTCEWRQHLYSLVSFLACLSRLDFTITSY